MVIIVVVVVVVVVVLRQFLNLSIEAQLPPHSEHRIQSY